MCFSALSNSASTRSKSSTVGRPRSRTVRRPPTSLWRACRVHSAPEIPADLRGFAPATSSTVTTRQLPAHAQYQSAVRPSSTSSRRAPAFNNASATDASLYEVVVKGVLAATLPIGGSFGLAPAFTSRSTIVLERAEMRAAAGCWVVRRDRYPARSTSARSERHRAQSLQKSCPSSLEPNQPVRVISSRASSSRNTQRFVSAAASILRSNSARESGAAT